MLDAHAHLCLLASEEEKVNLGFCEGVAEQFYIGKHDYPARKFWSGGGGVQYKRAIIGLPAKHHLNGVSLIDDPTWNADLVAL